MSLSSFSIKRPITTAMIFLAFCLMGVISLTRLPVELYPDIAFGQISIIVYIRGGIPPTEVESMVTRPIEEAVSTVANLDSMLSISKEGESTVVLSFERGINMQLAAMEVREKFAKVKEKLPRETEKPVIAQFSQTDVPIVIAAITSSRRSTEDIRRIVDEDFKERMKRITGVASVEVGGGRERKIIVEADRRALHRYGVSINRLIGALGSSNLSILTGELERAEDKLLIRAIGQFVTIDDIKRAAVLTHPDGSIVRVRDLAEVKDSYLDPQSYARINVSPIVSVYIQKESKANTIQVAARIMEEIENVRTILPDDIEVIITKNQASFIKKSISNLRDALLRGAVMIIFILMLFMGKLGKKAKVIVPLGLATAMLSPPPLLYGILLGLSSFLLFAKKYRPILIVAVSIPISLIITFGIMELSNILFPAVMDLTINFITLFGLALGVGMLVDNSIVVFENIVTKTEMGLDRVKAAEVGSTEMNVVIFASTLTTVIVFLPMLFVSKSLSILYGGVAWTVTISLLVSLFVALMIVPLMSSRVKVVEGKDESSRVKEEGFLRFFYGLQQRALLFVFRRRLIFIAAAGLLFVLSMYLYGRMGKEYLGTTEQNRFTIFVELPTGARLDASDEVVRDIEKMLEEIPEVKNFTSRVEGWSSKIYVELVGLGQRRRSISEVIDSLRPKVERLQPAFIYFEEEQEVGTKEIILNVYGHNYDILREIAIALTTRMGNIPYFTDTKIRMREGRPELNIRIDRGKSAYFGFSTKEIADMVHAKVRGVRATMYHTRASEVETIVRMQEKDRRTVKDIHSLIISEVGDDGVLLTQMADFEYGLGPSEIWRRNRSRMIQVSANIGELPLGKAAEMLEAELEDMRLPEDYFYEVGGDYPTLQKTQKEFFLTIVVIVTLIYLVLASIFESYRQPFIIMVTVLLATIGAIVSLYLTKTAIGIGALIGLMMLAGIVVNNGIILVDHANELKHTRTNLFRMLMQAARDRLRPVLMTTSTTIFGLLPMALDRSEGSNLWNPLAITVIGGLLFATPLTLVLVPSIYSLFEQFGHILRKTMDKPLGPGAILGAIKGIIEKFVTIPFNIADRIDKIKKDRNKPHLPG